MTTIKWICFVLALLHNYSSSEAVTENGIPEDSVMDSLKSLFHHDSNSSGGIDFICVIEHCMKESLGCLFDSVCRDAILCSQGCLKDWDNDTTPEKFHVQNCTSKCSFSYNDQTYQSFMACFTHYKCMSFKPIPSTCKTVRPIKQLSMKDIKGDWWMVRGYNPVYDCYPCQHLYFEPINASYWSYNPRYQVYLTNGSLSLVSQKMVIPDSDPGHSLSFQYYDTGLLHFETWWLIDMADDDSYVLLYYCGHTLQWNYEGALVFSRNRTLTQADYSNISIAYKSIGLDFDSFCYPSTSSKCPD